MSQITDQTDAYEALELIDQFSPAELAMVADLFTTQGMELQADILRGQIAKLSYSEKGGIRKTGCERVAENTWRLRFVQCRRGRWMPAGTAEVSAVTLVCLLRSGMKVESVNGSPI